MRPLRVALVAACVAAAAVAASAAPARATPVLPPMLTKSFDQGPIPLGGGTVLAFSLSNPNTATTLTGVAFTDVYPLGLVSPNRGTVSPCGSGSVVLAADSVTVSGVVLQPGASCAIAVNLTATTLGPKLNSTTPVTSDNGGTGSAATSSVTVGYTPTITKTFGTSPITVGSTTTLTFELTNSNPLELHGAAFSDPLPAGLVLAPNGLSNSCGGTLSAAAGGSSITLTGALLEPSSAGCAVVVSVTGTTTGAKNNTTGELRTDEGLTGSPATASLEVLPVQPPALAKAFSPSILAVRATTTLTFTLTNPNPTLPLSRITFADPFPPGLMVAANPSVTNTCGGVPSVGPFALAVAYANARLAPAGSCTFSVKVVATSPGLKHSTTTVVSSAPGGTGSPAAASVTVTP